MRQHLRGLPPTIQELTGMTNTSTCAGPECERPVNRAKLCRGHQAQKRRVGMLTPIAPRVGRYEPGTLCGYYDCPHPAKARGLCARHYGQSRHPGGVRDLRPKQIPVATRNDKGEKRCSRCLTWRDPAQFASSAGKADGLQSHCRRCKASHYRANADKVRDKMREQRFSITRAEFDAWFDSQGNVCATCGTDDPGKSYWCVDHDHACCPGSEKTCGKCIRGILCHRCNHALGNVRDNPKTLARMIDYLAEGVIDVRAAA